jgi:hypothetical protein
MTEPIVKIELPEILQDYHELFQDLLKIILLLVVFHLVYSYSNNSVTFGGMIDIYISIILAFVSYHLVFKQLIVIQHNE